jgi:bZIP transcription factor
MLSDRYTSGSVPAKKRKYFPLEAEAGGAAAAEQDEGTTSAFCAGAHPATPTSARIFKKREADPRSRAARQHRLAQNRQAARESRKKKKAMVEELQRRLVFFSKANAALRNEHQDLTRRILSAHAELARLGLLTPAASASSSALAASATSVLDVAAASAEPGPSVAMGPGSVMAAPLGAASIDSRTGFLPMNLGATTTPLELPSQQRQL